MMSSFLIPRNVSPGLAESRGCCVFIKTQGPCGDLAVKKKRFVCFAKPFVRFVVKKIRFFNWEIASLAYAHSS